jgi:hypothetical protein
MLSEHDARRLAERALAEMAFDGGLVIIGVEQFEPGWVFCYDSVRHQQTKASSDSIVGNAPLLVDRVDGTVHVTGTARPTEDYIAEYIAARPRDDLHTDAVEPPVCEESSGRASLIDPA